MFDASALLGSLPESLRLELLAAYEEIVRNYREGRWEPSELNGGKLCEVAYSVIRGYADGKMPPRAKKPSNMVDACRRLEGADPALPRSIRIQIPRVLVALYEIRNNRGVGHVGGDVDANPMDARLVLEASKWIMAELVRVFHVVDVDTATRAVDALVARMVPMIWHRGAVRRVLDPSLSRLDKTLLLLYGSDGPVDEAELRNWVEAANASAYRRDVLRKAHKKKLIEYDAASSTVEISPTGIRFVEEQLPLVY